MRRGCPAGSGIIGKKKENSALFGFFASANTGQIAPDTGGTSASSGGSLIDGRSEVRQPIICRSAGMEGSARNSPAAYCTVHSSLPEAVRTVCSRNLLYRRCRRLLPHRLSAAD